MALLLCRYQERKIYISPHTVKNFGGKIAQTELLTGTNKQNDKIAFVEARFILQCALKPNSRIFRTLSNKLLIGCWNIFHPICLYSLYFLLEFFISMCEFVWLIEMIFSLKMKSWVKLRCWSLPAIFRSIKRQRNKDL